MDGGGGFGGGVRDLCETLWSNLDDEGNPIFPVLKYLEIHNGSPAHDIMARQKYANLVTEMYAEAAETLFGIRIEKPTVELKADLCQRHYDWVNVRGKSLRKLEDKEKFRKNAEPPRSPDDGDGFVLAVAPDFLFETPPPSMQSDTVELGSSLSLSGLGMAIGTPIGTGAFNYGSKSGSYDPYLLRGPSNTV